MLVKGRGLPRTVASVPLLLITVALLRLLLQSVTAGGPPY
jgi:hypothetical protein